ncbi:hypothetical protein MIR68_008887 [Amoeboaphelidium protococcarum]|nr:hypothetical protein MIR68_008887 [Amoeboaphelidium protococcarum]KAI3648255.1 hypothetical protein MP228_006109 [Amoeboaphelidium protococcarum]
MIQQEVAKDIVIVGGGLVGSLLAVVLSQKPWKPNVRVYEQRPDIRKEKMSAGKSINLALSHRGLKSLALAGEDVLREVEKILIPMKGRMLHVNEHDLQEVLYGVHGECINSVDRKKLNCILLDAFEQLQPGKVYFKHELQTVDYDTKKLTFKDAEGQIVEIGADLIIGADGAYSSVRREMMKKNRMNFKQEYIDHGYMELNIPASAETGSYQMSSNHLHIWPKKTFMMIALPNTDKSFTTTLFMPYADFDHLRASKDDQLIIDFFKLNFPDAVQLLGGEQAVVSAMRNNVVGSLISIKCHPYNYENSVIVGDASHAMVPFYGQGMNAGFEDVLVLDEFLHGESLPAQYGISQRLSLYSKARRDDAHAICDLALYNYEEMRNDVLTPVYRIRKTVESLMNRVAPETVIPLYSMVSFTSIPYSRVVRRWKRQSLIFNAAGGAFIGISLAVGLVAFRRLFVGSNSAASQVVRKIQDGSAAGQISLAPVQDSIFNLYFKVEDMSKNAFENVKSLFRFQ